VASRSAELPASTRARLGILISGRGSNLLALHAATRDGRLPAEIAVVISNRKDAAGCERARERGLPTVVIEKGALDRAGHEARILAELRLHGVEWVCLAGYMRILGPTLVDAYPQRIVNIHPSLLPAFPGRDAQRQAWEYGVRIAGCTVHMVDRGLDSGPIVEQQALEVSDAASAKELAERLLPIEHELYATALRRLLTETWIVEGRRVVFSKKEG
jgi:phosphoribosylglycinamide formyltransferase-1